MHLLAVTSHLVCFYLQGELGLFGTNEHKGMAKAVADTDNPNENTGGYSSDNSNITGFSMLHDSGTGGVSLQFFSD
jgi:putative alpha-1,2-mannosidase